MRIRLLLSFVLASAASAAARPAVPAPAGLQDRVNQAIVRAIEQRMGSLAQVIVDDVEIFSAKESGAIEAVPAPGARTGERVSFELLGATGTDGSRRVVTVGRATATVRVAVPHLKASRLITRGEDVEAGDLLSVEDDVAGVPLRRLPTLDQVAGGHALRNIAAGEVVTGLAVTVTPAVRSGQLVRATAAIDGAEVSAMVIAAQNGEPGAVILVVNRDSHRQLRARVIGEGLVEVIHE